MRIARFSDDLLLRMGASALIAGMPLLFVPLQIAHLNDAFLVFRSLHFLPVLMLLWLGAAAILTWCAGLLSGRWRRTVPPLLLSLAAFVWASAWLVTPDVWFMDRASLAPAACEGWTCLSSGLAIGGALLALCLLALAGMRFPRESGLMCLLLCVGMGLNAIYETATEPAHVTWQPATQELWRFSKRGNVLVILLDAFQGDMFHEILAQDVALRSEFNGFSSYTDALAPASTTYLSLPGIHSGASYEQGGAISAYYDEAVQRKSFMTALSHRGFRTLLLNPIMERCPKDMYWCGHQASVMDGVVSSFERELSLLLRLGLRRSLPPALAHEIDGRWSFDFDIHGLILNSHELLRRMSREIVVDDGPPSAKFLHLLATHAPARVGESCKPGDVSFHPWDHQSLRFQAHCALRRTAELMAAMRRTGVFDNTAIYLISDHGAGLRHPQTDPQGLDPNFFLNSRLAHAILVQKKAGATQAPLKLSALPVSLADLPQMVCADLCADAFGPRKDTRQFLSYDWRDALWTSNTLSSVRTFQVTAPVSDPSGWRLLPNFKPTATLQLAAMESARQLGFGWGEVDALGARKVSGIWAQVYLSAPVQTSVPVMFRFRAAMPQGAQPQTVTALIEGKAICSHLLATQMRAYDCPVVAGQVMPTAPGGAMQVELRFTGIGRDGWQNAYSSPASFESIGIE